MYVAGFAVPLFSPFPTFSPFCLSIHRSFWSRSARWSVPSTMSLYAGIKFNKSQAENDVSTSTDLTPITAPAQTLQQTTASASPAVSSPTPESSRPNIVKPAGEWSAALKFAPRIPKPKPTTPARPAGFSATTYSAAPTVIEAKADIIRTADPQLKVEDDVVLGPDGKPLAKAPAMTLVAAGAKGNGKKAAKREWERQRLMGEGAARKKKKKVCPSRCTEPRSDYGWSELKVDSGRRRTINLCYLVLIQKSNMIRTSRTILESTRLSGRDSARRNVSPYSRRN